MMMLLSKGFTLSTSQQVAMKKPWWPSCKAMSHTSHSCTPVKSKKKKAQGQTSRELRQCCAAVGSWNQSCPATLPRHPFQHSTFPSTQKTEAESEGDEQKDRFVVVTTKSIRSRHYCNIVSFIMKFVALVSGGKDSIYSIMESQRHGHELVACIHLGAPLQQEEESYMYQTAASSVLPILVKQCLGVPLVLYRRSGKSVNTSLVYEQDVSDEVEDLYEAIASAVQQFPFVKAVCSGAILSTYQRVRIEHVCGRLNLTSLSYLWRSAPQEELLVRMLKDGIEAVLVKTACPPGLVPQKHLNQTLGKLYYSGLFQKLHEKYQFHMCGEGGEFETLVLDCPIFMKKLVLDEVEICETDDGVGELIIKHCHAEEKTKEVSKTSVVMTEPSPPLSKAVSEEEKEESVSAPLKKAVTVTAVATPRFHPLPHVRRMRGGLFHVSEMTSPAIAGRDEETEADLAVKEALAIFQILDQVLKIHGATPKDVVFVHLYLVEMSLFSKINTHYQDFFGTLLPPSRSCVAVGKQQSGNRVVMDCIVQCGSGSYMRMASSTNTDPQHDNNSYAHASRLTTTSQLRQVLHVQSISSWAPVCVGPYSQANTLRSGLHFLAGQIGLVPATMKLRQNWQNQLVQCWINVASVLDALDSTSLKDMVSGLIYVNQDEVLDWQLVESISQQQITCNGGIVPGRIESSTADQYGGYEDEETFNLETLEKFEKQDSNIPPLLVVSIPEMPVGALVEVEVICATRRAASCLKMETTCCGKLNRKSPIKQAEASVQWGTGHEECYPPLIANQNVDINVASQSLGYGCAAASIVTASFRNDNESQMWCDVDCILEDMLEAFRVSVLTTSSGLTLEHVMHVRLFYMAAAASGQESSPFSSDCIQSSPFGNDPRCALHSAIGLCWGRNGGTRENLPACTSVPVERIAMFQTRSDGRPDDSTNGHVLLAMQVLVVDPIHMETEIWIHNGRDDDS